MKSEEQDWLKAAIDGDNEAFSKLIMTYQTPVYNLCSRMLGNQQDAEDAAQETFWRAYQNMRKYDPDRSFITWILSIAAHYCIDQQRKKKLASVDFDALPEEIIPDYSQTSPEQALSLKQHNARLQELLNRLVPDDRAAIILRYWYAFSEQEIADSLHLSISAVKSRLFRSRKQIAALISAQDQSRGQVREREYESSTI